MAYIDSYGVEYSEDKKTLVKCPTSLEGSYTVLHSTEIIGENAFMNCEKLEQVILPNGIIGICEMAFDGCKGLCSILIPDSIQYIEQWAFCNCEHLKEVEIHGFNLEAGNNIFLGCDNVTRITVPGDLKISDCFHTDNIESVSILEGSCVINDEMFELCDSLIELHIPSSVNEIQEGAFHYCKKLNKIVLDPSNQSFVLSDGALYDKYKTKLILVLKGVEGTFTIPNSVEIVYDKAFDDCTNIKTIIISDKLEKIPITQECKSLTSFVVNNNAKFSSLNGVVYNHAKDVLVRCPEGYDGEFIIPSFVKHIQKTAFFRCNKLSRIILSEGLISIGESAFWFCDGLSEISIPSSVTEIEDNAFSCSITKINVDTNNCKFYSDGKILIDNDKSSIVFVCKNIEGLAAIPNGIVYITNYAFSECRLITSISFPESLKEIGSGAFFDCKLLEKVSFNDGLEKLGALAFSCCDKLTEVALPNSLISFKDVFNDWKIEKLSIPVGTKAIMSDDDHWRVLKSVLLNNGFETIEKDLFKGCTTITDITIPASLKTVEANAFDDCKALKNIHYEGTLEEWLAMDWRCFVKNGYDLYIQGKLLTDIVLDGSISEIRDNAFYYCNSLQHIEIRDGVKKIGTSAFNKTSVCSDVFVPDSVYWIGDYAFLSCKELKTVSISNNTGLGNSVFRYCDKLESVCLRGSSNQKEGCHSFYYTIDGILFLCEREYITTFWIVTSTKHILCHYPCGRKATKYVVPSEIEALEDYAFTGVTNLTLFFRKFVSCKKNTFLNAKVKIQVPIGTKQQFIDGGYPKDAIEEIDVERYLDRTRVHDLCLELVKNNPFRMLGVYADASLKEITANKTKAARYSSVAKTVSFDADMEGLLSPLNRTSESIDKAFADISLPQDKIKYALTWFVKGGNLDGMALDYIKNGDYDKAFEILAKKETWSSLLNKGALSFAKKDVEGAIETVTKLIHDEEYRNEFVTCVCGNSFKINEDELAHSFIDILLNGHESPTILDIFEEYGESADDDDYIREKLTSAPVARIKSAIAKAKDVDTEDSDASYLAGSQLRENTKADLNQLKQLVGDNALYAMTADSLAKQILQCGINYYNNSFDDQYERLDKAYALQNYALQLAVGAVVKGRCKENVDILLNIKLKLPPKEVKIYFDKINSLLSAYRSKSKSFEDVIKLIKDCATHLVAIKEFTGSTYEAYLAMSTTVVDAALSVTIDKVNQSQKKDIFGNYDFSKIKNALKESWRVILYLNRLDMDSSYKNNRFKENKGVLKKMIYDLNGFGILVVLSDESTLNRVFGENIIVDLDLRTESEYFNACKTKIMLRNYLVRYPNGKYLTQTKQKLTTYEKSDWLGCKTLADYKKYLTEYPYGLYANEAKAKVAILEEELKWSDCSANDTITDYNDYLSKYPSGKYLQEAKVAIERLKEEQRKDEEFWKTCSKKEDYDNYLKTFPRALHKKEAEERLETIAQQKETLIWVSVGLVIGIAIVLGVLFG